MSWLRRLVQHPAQTPEEKHVGEQQVEDFERRLSRVEAQVRAIKATMRNRPKSEEPR